MDILLYGAASIGNIMYHRLDKSEFNILGYIDKRAEEIGTFNNVQVWSVKEAAKRFNNDTILVYVSVKNVFEHSTIAKMLYYAGFRKIVFKPYGTLIGVATADETKLADVYDRIFENGKWCFAMEDIPDVLTMNTAYHDFAKIKEDEKYVWAYIPCEYVFSNNYKNEHMKKWGNVNIAAFFTHIQFFQSLAGTCEYNISDYVEEYCVYTARFTGTIKVTEAWKSNVVHNRTQIYEQMRLALELDPDFFVRNAAEAIWNEEKGYFNLVSGKHRCTFLAAMGRRFIPLKLLKEEYDIFLNRDLIEEVKVLLNQQGKEMFIPHPAFYRAMSEGFYKKWDEDRNVICNFAKQHYREKGDICFDACAIVDDTLDYGERARLFAKIGFDVQRTIKQGSLEEAINKLCNIKNIQYSCSGEDLCDTSI